MLSPLLQLTANCDAELGYVGEVTSQIQPEDIFTGGIVLENVKNGNILLNTSELSFPRGQAEA